MESSSNVLYGVNAFFDIQNIKAEINGFSRIFVFQASISDIRCMKESKLLVNDFGVV